MLATWIRDVITHDLGRWAPFIDAVRPRWDRWYPTHELCRYQFHRPQKGTIDPLESTCSLSLGSALAPMICLTTPLVQVGGTSHLTAVFTAMTALIEKFWQPLLDDHERATLQALFPGHLSQNPTWKAVRIVCLKRISAETYVSSFCLWLGACVSM